MAFVDVQQSVAGQRGDIAATDVAEQTHDDAYSEAYGIDSGRHCSYQGEVAFEEIPTAFLARTLAVPAYTALALDGSPAFAVLA